MIELVRLQLNRILTEAKSLFGVINAKKEFDQILESYKFELKEKGDPHG